MSGLTIDQLRERVRGEIITADDEGYEEARKVYNAMIDRRPRVVVRAVDAGDVMAAVDFARENGLDLAVRGGGHSVPGFGTCDDGVVIDLRRHARRARRPRQARTARAEGGATWGDFNHATYAFGLATTGGIISTTGIGGLTLGGGIGYLARGFGLSIDNLISADVVTADGRLLVASEKENEDLFWALRGGGGNFGVVTSFEYRLHPVKDVYGGPMFFELDHAGDRPALLPRVRRRRPRRSWACSPAFQIAPPLPFIPEERHGDTFIIMVACWSGPLAEGERALKPIRDVAPVVAEFVGPMPYPALNSAFDALVPRRPAALLEGELRDGAHRRCHRRPPGARAEDPDRELGGAHLPHQRCRPARARQTRRPSPTATPTSPPSSPACGPTRPTTRPTSSGCATTTRPRRRTREEGGYVNFLSGDDQGKIRANYRGNYDRLVDVKKKYDPDNLFHLNQNISPTGSESAAGGSGKAAA